MHLTFNEATEGIMREVINSFTGGIKNKLDPVFLSSNEAQDTLDCIVDNGLLVPARGVQWQASVKEHMYKVLDGIEISASRNIQVKTLHSRVYTANINKDQSSPAYVLSNGVKHEIPLSKTTGVIAFNTLAYNGVLESLETDTTPGTTTFAFTKYNSKTGYESKPRYLEKHSINSSFTIDRLYPNVTGTTVGGTVTVDGVTIKTSLILSNISNGRIKLKGAQTNFTFAQHYDVTNEVKSFVHEFLVGSAYNDDDNKTRDDYYNALQPDIASTSVIHRCLDYYRTQVAEGTAFDQLQLDDMAEYLFSKKLDLTNPYLYKYSYTPSIKSVSIDISSQPNDYKTRVYRLGPFGKLGHNTDYLLQATTNSNIVTLTENDSISTDKCKTINQINELMADMIAVSTSNLWIARGNKAYFSTVGSRDIIENLHFVSLPSEITGMHYVNERLVVTCVDSSVHTIVGNNLANIKLSRIADDIDCIDVRTMSRATQTLIWLSSKGLVATNGAVIKLVGRDSLKDNTYTSVFNDTGLNTVSSASLNDEYYLLYNNRMFVYHLKYNRLLKYTTESAERLFLYKGDIYANTSNTYGKVLQAADRPLKYVTGTLVKDSYSFYKEFQFFRFSYRGAPNIKIYVDKLLITDITLPMSSPMPPKGYVSDLKLVREALQIKEGVVGFTCHIEVTGICEINNMEVIYNIKDEL